MTTDFPAHFARQYDSHLKHLKLKGLQPKTIDAKNRGLSPVSFNAVSIWTKKQGLR